MTYTNPAPLNYGYSGPLTYGQMSQYPMQVDQQSQQGVPQPIQIEYEEAPVDASLPAATAGVVLGTIGGTIAGWKNNPYIKAGEATDKFAQKAYEQWIKHAPKEERVAYREFKSAAKKIDHISNVKGLARLFDSKPTVAKAVCDTMSTTPEEYLKDISKSNFKQNKATLKNKLLADNKTRCQDMKNKIVKCWHEGNRKGFVQPEKMDDAAFKAIKKAERNLRGTSIAKYAVIGGAITGAIAFGIAKLWPLKDALLNKKS